MQITVKPKAGSVLTDEEGRIISAPTTLSLTEFLARRINDGDLIIIKPKGKSI